MVITGKWRKTGVLFVSNVIHFHSTVPDMLELVRTSVCCPGESSQTTIFSAECAQPFLDPPTPPPAARLTTIRTNMVLFSSTHPSGLSSIRPYMADSMTTTSSAAHCASSRELWQYSRSSGSRKAHFLTLSKSFVWLTVFNEDTRNVYWASIVDSKQLKQQNWSTLQS